MKIENTSSEVESVVQSIISPQNTHLSGANG